MYFIRYTFISWPGRYKRYSYLSIFADDTADIFGVSLLILYCSFSCLILPVLSWLVFLSLLKEYFWNVVDYLMQG